MGDLAAGTGAWEGVDDTVRSAVHVLFNLVLAQSEKLSELQTAVAVRPDFEYVERLTTGLVPREALESHATEVGRRLNDKVGHADLVQAVEQRSESDAAAEAARQGHLEKRLASLEANLERVTRTSADIVASLRRKADSEQLRRFASRAEVDRKADIDLVNEGLKLKANKDVVDKALSGKAAKSDVDGLLTAIGSKAGKVEVVDFVESKVREAAAQCEVLQRRLEAMQEAQAANPPASATEVEAALKAKADREEVRESFKKRITPQQLEARLAELQEEIGKDVSREVHIAQRESHQEIVQVLNRKAYKADVHRALQAKANVGDLERLLGGKADGAAVAAALRRKADASDVGALRTMVEGLTTDDGWRGTIARLESDMRLKAGRLELESLAKVVHAKSDIADVEDLKFKVIDLTRAVDLGGGGGGAEGGGSASSVDGKRSPRAADAAAHGVPRTPEPMPLVADGADAPELPVGRWIWKSHWLGASGMVPWEAQAVNENPDELVWREGGDTVLAVRPGLYEVVGGFFSASPCRVSLVVNGQAVITTPNPDGTPPVVRHEHPSGSVSGVTMLEFLALPANAHVGVVYTGESQGQGFFGLRKL